MSNYTKMLNSVMEQNTINKMKRQTSQEKISDTNSKLKKISLKCKKKNQKTLRNQYIKDKQSNRELYK